MKLNFVKKKIEENYPQFLENIISKNFKKKRKIKTIFTKNPKNLKLKNLRLCEQFF